jgi:hypothetical protein
MDFIQSPIIFLSTWPQKSKTLPATDFPRPLPQIFRGASKWKNVFLTSRGWFAFLCTKLPGKYNPADILSKHWAYASVWWTMNALLFARGDTWDLLDDECREE